MKNLILVIIIGLCSFKTFGQIEFGMKGGLSSYDLAKEGLLYIGKDQNLAFNIQNAGYGHHFGLYTRLSAFGLYLEPSLLFNSNTVTYAITEYSEPGVIDKIRSETYNYLDIPVLAGFKVGLLRFHGGVVGHLFINSISDLADLSGYDQKFKSATYGWQAGGGIDIWRLRLEVNYEGNLTKFGDHINIGGTPLSFADRPSRVIMSVGFRF
ncbi:MAG: outer membrane beta-barrel protein [Saprospiraceae bacterium]|nr:outer membrane beta-barrel protein [Saprospiraceae bacterium]